MPSGRASACIFLYLTGGPSHLETFDPKPDAPAEIRGPFASIATSVPGTRISEHLPRLAAMAHRYAIVRSVHHKASPVHETGQRYLQSGRLDADHPTIGTVLSDRLGAACGLAAGAIDNAPFALRCQQALTQIESGARFVTIPMFDAPVGQVTWDCHADARFLPSTLDDYRKTHCPTFDQACAALIEGLHQRGLLARTLVVAAGEMGRTPHLNDRGGRDHWPGVWSVLLAGAGIRGGAVLGASDKHGTEPARRPVHAADLAATVYHAFGIDPRADIVGRHGEKVPLTEGRPILELFE
jgi:hypothetical protein